MAERFFSTEWAQEIRAAMDQGPDEEVRAAKLPMYWNWIEHVRATYSASWALGVRDLPGSPPTYLMLSWQDGKCAEAAVTTDPAGADYVLIADLDIWRDLLAGGDPGRIVMYRGLRLQRGDVLMFFRAIYLFVESIAMIGRVPATAFPS
jgi:hypothetical protein